MESPQSTKHLTVPPLKESVPAEAVKSTAGFAVPVAGGGNHALATDSVDFINPKPIPPDSFPDAPIGDSKLLPATIANVRHLLQSYRITVQYDEIKKRMTIRIPGYAGAPDNADEVAVAHIYSLANLNGLSTNQLLNYVSAIGDANRINRVANWIECKQWDGQDRLRAFYDTLEHRPDFSQQLKKTLMYRWLLSAVAAVMKPSGFRNRGVLTIQGPQSIGKTTWISNLVSDDLLRDDFVKLDHHLDAGNKDSLLTAIAHWIVEIGELDSSFKKDIARLKGFLTTDRDKVRRPYGRTDSEYPRRTVFCATVNDQSFLIDSTGNTRWWTIPVTAVNHTHRIDMQQLFAQVAIDFRNGEQWWLTQVEEACLESYNANHRVITAIGERVLGALDLSRVGAPDLPAMTPTELLGKIGVNNPSNTNCKDCAAVLREHLGDSKRINGLNKWRVPLKQETWAANLRPNQRPDDRF